MLISFESIDLFGFLISILFSFFGYGVVIYRYYLLTNKKISIKASYEANFVCWGLNNILPSKLGEVAKSIFLKKVYNFNSGISFAKTIIERFMDIFVLFLLMILSMNIFELKDGVFIIVGIFIVLFIAVFRFILKYPALFVKFIKKKLPTKVQKFSRDFVKALARTNKSELITLFVLTLILWFFQYLWVYMFFKLSTNLNLNELQILVVFLAISLSFALPSTPGAVGVLQAGVIMTLGMFGVESEIAFACGVVIHLVQFIPTVLISTIILLKYNLNLLFFKTKRGNI